MKRPAPPPPAVLEKIARRIRPRGEHLGDLIVIESYRNKIAEYALVEALLHEAAHHLAAGRRLPLRGFELARSRYAPENRKGFTSTWVNDAEEFDAWAITHLACVELGYWRARDLECAGLNLQGGYPGYPSRRALRRLQRERLADVLLGEYASQLVTWFRYVVRQVSK